MATWKTPGLVAKQRGNFTQIDYKDLFMRFTAPKNVGESNTYTIRFLEAPIPVLVHWPKKKDPKTKKSYDCPFPDEQFSKRPSRISYARVDDEGNIVEDPSCPWTKAGYSRQLRYYVNVIDRERNMVRIADCPATVMEAVANYVASQEKRGRECDPSSWTKATYDFDVIVERTSGEGGVKYSINVDPESKGVLSAEDLALIKNIPLNAEKTNVSEYKLYDLKPFTTPTPLKTSADKPDTIEADDSAVELKRAVAASAKADEVFAGKSEEDESIDLSDLEGDYL